jgi:hypothetical protein
MRKAMSKKSKDQNALKHGVYAKILFLPGEKAGDYELLVKELYEEWAPEGVTERNLVDRLVCSIGASDALNAMNT